MPPPNEESRTLINTELEGWSDLWVLIEHSIFCVACNAGQNASDAAQAFTHGESCALAESKAQYPWHELYSTLEFLPRVKP